MDEVLDARQSPFDCPGGPGPECTRSRERPPAKPARSRPRLPGNLPHPQRRQDLISVPNKQRPMDTLRTLGYQMPWLMPRNRPNNSSSTLTALTAALLALA